MVKAIEVTQAVGTCIMMIRPASPRPTYCGTTRNIAMTTPVIQSPSMSFAACASWLLPAMKSSLPGIGMLQPVRYHTTFGVDEQTMRNYLKRVLSCVTIGGGKGILEGRPPQTPPFQTVSEDGVAFRWME